MRYALLVCFDEAVEVTATEKAQRGCAVRPEHSFIPGFIG
jgi:hypothetical protein